MDYLRPIDRHVPRKPRLVGGELHFAAINKPGPNERFGHALFDQTSGEKSCPMMRYLSVMREYRVMED